MLLPSFYETDWNKKHFPDFENTTEEEKNMPGYGLRVSEAIYARYKQGKTEYGAQGLGTFFDTLRLFGKGKQPTERYKSYFAQGGMGFNGSSNIVMSGIDTNLVNSYEYNKKGWMNVNWDIVSPIPNLKTIVHGKFINIDYDIKADAIDIDSGAEQESRMYRYYAKVNYNGIFNALRSQAGLQPEIPGYVPGSKKELEELKAEGGFKMPYSSELEKLILETENISYWDRSLKKKFLDDIIDLGYAFAYAEYDKETCKVMWKYADPKDVLVQYSKKNDFRDVDWAAIHETMTVSELKAMMPYIVNLKTGDKATVEDIYKIAKTYKGYSDSPSELEWNNFDNEIIESTQKYDDFKILVQKTWWIDAVNNKKIKYTTKQGKSRFYEYNAKVKKLSDREEVKNTRVRKTYQCTWFVGTDFGFGHGIMPNQPREPVYKPLLPLVGVKFGEKSYVHRLIPVVDVFQVAWLKLQNAIAIAAEDGYAVNISNLANVGDGSQKFDPFKVLRFWKEKGIMFYKNPPLGQNVGGAPLPVTNVPGGLEQMFTKYLVIMENMIKKIEDLTGLSPIALGAAPTQQQGLGTSQMAVQASEVGMTSLVDVVRDLKERLAIVTSPMVQLAIQNDEKARKEYAGVIGEEGVDIIRMARKAGVRYGLSLVGRPTNEEWIELINVARASFQRRSPEVGGLDESQYMWIMHQKNAGGNFKEIMFKMASWIRQDKERIRMERERMVQLQSQGQQQAARVQGEEMRKNQMMALQAMIRQINEKAKMDILAGNSQSLNKREEIYLQENLKMGNTMVAEREKAKVEQEKSQM